VVPLRLLPERLVLDSEVLKTLPRLVWPDPDPEAGGLGGGDGVTAIPVTVQ
jgi:hypothetical protein